MNIANKLTVFRVLLIPVFLLAFWYENRAGNAYYISIAVFLLASITDYADGLLARRLNLITNFGKFMDPLADKLLVAAALIALTAVGAVHPWVTITIVCREFIVTGVRLIAAEQGVVIAADKTAKLKTVMQIVMVVYCLAGLQNLSSLFSIIWYVIITITILLTVFSAFNYIYKNKNIFKGGI